MLGCGLRTQSYLEKAFRYKRRDACPLAPENRSRIAANAERTGNKRATNRFDHSMGLSPSPRSAPEKPYSEDKHTREDIYHRTARAAKQRRT